MDTGTSRRYLCVYELLPATIQGRGMQHKQGRDKAGGAVVSSSFWCCIKRDCGKAWTQLEVRFSAFLPRLLETKRCRRSLAGEQQRGSRRCCGDRLRALAVAGGRERGPSC